MWIERVEKGLEEIREDEIGGEGCLFGKGGKGIEEGRGNKMYEEMMDFGK